MSPTRAAAVDTRRAASLSFAPPEPTARHLDPSSAQPRRVPIAVGPGRPVAAPIPGSGGLLGVMSEYPVQIEKVQAPPLRDDILARDRLLDWLAVKVHNRVVLLTAEAGYGKTTLLADFARRTRLRVLWFRLDRGDRDWVGFIAYLVAAVRVHVPDFGPATASLLRETGSSAPPRDAVLDTFLRELGEIPTEPAAMVFDDFHLVDDAADVRHVVKELLTRAPERLSFVFASRRTPPLRLARLRALGEIAELDTDDLRFDAGETERLFRDTYAMRLEPGLIAELSRRTEGWAASLQLVHAALHDRDAAGIRAFIRSLSGAEGHLYDYLAEEVVGDLPEELQEFLMRTSLLDTVDLRLGPVAAEVSIEASRRLIDAGERLGLFGRQAAESRHQVRAHPLVRDFLQARLARSVGSAAVAGIHHRIAVAAEAFDWRIAAHHYLGSGAPDDARRVLSDSLETILATGAYAAAEEVMTFLEAPTEPTPVELVLRSRLAQQREEGRVGLGLAEQASTLDPTSVAVLLNLVTARSLAGDLPGALEASDRLALNTNSPLYRIGRAYRAIIRTSLDGSLLEAVAELDSVIAGHRGSADYHYLGVALSNKSYVLRACGQAEEALVSAEQAIDLLSRGAAGIELVSARLARAAALAHLGRLQEAREEISLARAAAPPHQELEVWYEACEIEAFYGSARVEVPFASAPTVSSPDAADQLRLARVFLHARSGRAADARIDLTAIKPGTPRTSVAFEARRLLAQAMVSAAQQDGNAFAAAQIAATHASAQGAGLWARVASLVAAALDGEADPSPAISRAAAADPAVLSMAAEPLTLRLAECSTEALGSVLDEIDLRPERWRSALRLALGSESVATCRISAMLLVRIGEPDDVYLLRDHGRSARDRVIAANARSLARRLARRVLVEDLGRIRINVGSQVLEGSQVRRKVLALLCYLLSKPGHSASREEAIDALWPDQEPEAAMNSLNQTVYFLRRVFEPDYREEISPGYVHQDGESLWLDAELISSRSDRCRTLIRAMAGRTEPELVAELASAYQGRFALDFPYEEWASAFRDSLHAPYLRVMEHAIRRDLDAGDFANGIDLAERVHEVDPDSEEVQVALVRLYRLSGAFAAAAEQYERYASTIRDLGLEPTAMDDL